MDLGSLTLIGPVQHVLLGPVFNTKTAENIKVI